jgi:PAS domain S-box-containing protein
MNDETEFLSAEQYRAILGTTLDGFWLLDAEGKLLEVNDAYCRMTGFSRDELLGKRVADMTLQETPQEAREHLARIFHEGIGRFETRHRKKDGGSVFLDVSVSCVEQPEKRVVVFLRDIDERKRVEAALREGEQRYREIFNATSDALFIHDESGRILSVNQPMCAMFRCTYDEALALSIGDLSANLPPYTQAEAMQRVQQAQREGSSIFEWRSRRTDGELFWTEVALRFCTIGGHPRILASVRDIHARKLAEEAVRESEEKFSRIFHSSANLVAFTEPEEGRIVDVNDTWVNVLGVSREQAIGRSALALDLWKDPSKRERCMAALRENGRLRDFEIELQVKGGEMQLMASAEYVDVRGSRFLLWELRDISRQKQAEREQEALRAQLLQAQKLESVGRLAGGVAHDFNNLLTVINGYSSLLLNQLAPSDPMRRSVDEIRQAGERAAGLTQQLLVMSKTQVGQPRLMNLNAAVRETVRLVERIIGEDIHLVLGLDPDLGLVNADPVQIHQVMMNLAVNARDAMPEGGQLTLETSNTVVNASLTATGVSAAGDYVRLSVRDTGIGMNEETLRHIFEPFFTTKSKGTGTGLGLSTAYGIVRQAGGWIAVRSSPGKGATFEVFLPQAPGKEAAAGASEDEARERGGSETILVVEDQPSVRRFTGDVLRDLGYHVLEAGSGAEALGVSAGHEGSIDLILTDIIMPGMNGLALADRIRPLRPQARILYMTAYAGDVLQERGVHRDDLNCLEKPFHPSELARKVRDLLDQPSKGTTVLVVDDEAAVRELLNEMLSEAGYSVIEAENGVAALAVLGRTSVDVMVTDLVMPEKEGLETIGEARKRYPKMKIISMSGAFGGHYMKVASFLGADARVAKPIDRDALLNAIQGVLGERRP